MGERIRVLRKRNRVSLRALAGTAGISPSLLSQIENGKTQPSVGTLYALVQQLDTSFDDLFSDGTEVGELPALDGARVVQRSADNPILTMEHGVVWERLAVAGYSHVDHLLVKYDPGGASSTDGELMTHEGVEYGYLITGELRLHLESETLVIRAGDSLCFDSQRPHLYVNEGKQTATGVWSVVRDPSSSDSLFL